MWRPRTSRVRSWEDDGSAWASEDAGSRGPESPEAAVLTWVQRPASPPKCHSPSGGLGTPGAIPPTPRGTEPAGIPDPRLDLGCFKTLISQQFFSTIKMYGLGGNSGETGPELKVFFQKLTSGARVGPGKVTQEPRCRPCADHVEPSSSMASQSGLEMAPQERPALRAVCSVVGPRKRGKRQWRGPDQAVAGEEGLGWDRMWGCRSYSKSKQVLDQQGPR